MRYRFLAFALLAAAVVGFAFYPTWTASAQDPISVGHKITTGSQSITSSTSLVTAPDSATPVVIKSMVITSDTQGVVSFGSGSIPATRAGMLLNILVPANTPIEISPELIGDYYGATGTSTAAGANLHAIGPGTLTYEIRWGPR
jgi:hypothetical protein